MAAVGTLGGLAEGVYLSDLPGDINNERIAGRDSSKREAAAASAKRAAQQTAAAEEQAEFDKWQESQRRKAKRKKHKKKGGGSGTRVAPALEGDDGRQQRPQDANDFVSVSVAADGGSGAGAGMGSGGGTGPVPWFQAAADGDKQSLLDHLDHGQDPDARDRTGVTALKHAAESLHYRTCKLLLRRGASANVSDNLGFSPLHEAADLGSFKIVELLLDYDADPNSRNHAGQPPLDLSRGRLARYQRQLEEHEQQQEQEQQQQGGGGGGADTAKELRGRVRRHQKICDCLKDLTTIAAPPANRRRKRNSASRGGGGGGGVDGGIRTGSGTTREERKEGGQEYDEEQDHRDDAEHGAWDAKNDQGNDYNDGGRGRDYDRHKDGEEEEEEEEGLGHDLFTTVYNTYMRAELFLRWKSEKGPLLKPAPSSGQHGANGGEDDDDTDGKGKAGRGGGGGGSCWCCSKEGRRRRRLRRERQRRARERRSVELEQWLLDQADAHEAKRLAIDDDGDPRRLRRENYIPIEVPELILLLARELPGAEERNEFLTFCQQTQYHIESRLAEHSAEAERFYALLDPDRDTEPLLTLTGNPDPEGVGEAGAGDDGQVHLQYAIQKFRDLFRELVESANFEEITNADFEAALAETSDVGMQVKFEREGLFHRMTLFRRGTRVQMMVRPLSILDRVKFLLCKCRLSMTEADKKERAYPVDVYKRLMIAYRKEKEGGLADDASSTVYHLKLFKEFPRADLELIVPDARPVLSWIAILTIVLPVLTGIATIVYKVASGSAFANKKAEDAIAGTSDVLLDPTTNNVTAYLAEKNWTAAQYAAEYKSYADAELKERQRKEQEDLIIIAGLVVATLGYFYKSYSTFARTVRTYRANLTNMLFYRNIDNNRGVLTAVNTEGAWQEHREALLCYFFLWMEVAPGDDIDKDGDGEVDDDARDKNNKRSKKKLTATAATTATTATTAAAVLDEEGKAPSPFSTPPVTPRTSPAGGGWRCWARSEPVCQRQLDRQIQIWLKSRVLGEETVDFEITDAISGMKEIGAIETLPLPQPCVATPECTGMCQMYRARPILEVNEHLLAKWATCFPPCAEFKDEDEDKLAEGGMEALDFKEASCAFSANDMVKSFMKIKRENSTRGTLQKSG